VQIARRSTYVEEGEQKKRGKKRNGGGKNEDMNEGKGGFLWKVHAESPRRASSQIVAGGVKKGGGEE